MRIPITCDVPELEAVTTTPQAQLDQEYLRFLVEQNRHQRALMMRAQVWLSIGDTGKASAALSQGVSS